MEIKVKKPTEEELNEMGVNQWPIWEREKSTFDWHYDEKETCYLLEGDVEVETPGGNTVTFGAGDLVEFPEGLDCTWNIKKKVKKHYSFG